MKKGTMKGSSDGATQEQLLAALRHPLRRRLLKLMVERGGPMSPKEAADIVDEPLPRTSYHVRVLSECGTLALIDTKPVRGSLQHFYVPTALVTGTPWVRETLGMPPA